MNIKIIIPILLYFIAVFLISIIIYLRQKNNQQLTHYFLDNRSMGGFLLAMTMVVAYVSASSFIGGPGAAYKYGLGWVLLSIIQIPTILLSLSILGKKFAILARQYNAITLSDMLYARYQSHWIVIIAGISLVAAFLGAMTVQFIGGARLLETAAGIPYGTSLVIFVLITSFYTAIGGFKASIFNDALQGMIMLIGAFLLLFLVIMACGGISPAIMQLRNINPELLTPQGAEHFLTPSLMFSFWILVCFAVIGLPHTAVRCFAYKNSRAVHKGIIIGTIIISVLMITMHFAGVLGRALIPDITIPDQVVPTLMVKIFPPFVAGFFLAAPLAAIMSTINAQLLQTSSVIIKDLYLNLSGNQDKQQKVTRYSRIITFSIGLLLIVAAWNPPDMLIWLNILAFGGLEAVFLWPLVLGLYWSKANKYGALTSMLTGAISYTLLIFVKPSWLTLHAIVPTLLVSFIAFLIANVIGGQYHQSSSTNR